jgi:putative endonuclease
MSKIGYVYIMTNKQKTTLYIGVTNDLCRRIYEHKHHIIKDSFTDRYNLEYCIYYEEFAHFGLAIHREKELKKWNRQKKEDLINKKNPEWNVMATERGFVRDNIPFFQQVAAIIDEMQTSGKISSLGPNDGSQEGETTPMESNDIIPGSEILPFGQDNGLPGSEIPS